MSLRVCETIPLIWYVIPLNAPGELLDLLPVPEVDHLLLLFPLLPQAPKQLIIQRHLAEFFSTSCLPHLLDQVSRSWKQIRILSNKILTTFAEILHSLFLDRQIEFRYLDNLYILERKALIIPSYSTFVTLRDSATRFSTSGFCHESVPPSPWVYH